MLPVNKDGGKPFEKSSGLAMSITSLPFNPAAADSSAGTEPWPDVQLNASSPNAAASAKVPSEAFAPVAFTQARPFSWVALREPIFTS